MNVDPALKDILETFGPILLAAIGAILTSVCGLMAATARFVWKAHTSRMELIAKALQDLAEAIAGQDEKMKTEHKKIWETVQSLRAELVLANRNTEYVSSGLLKMEGALENHRTTIYHHIEKLGKIDSKLDAVFRFLDAPRRATD